MEVGDEPKQARGFIVPPAFGVEIRQTEKRIRAKLAVELGCGQLCENIQCGILIPDLEELLYGVVVVDESILGLARGHRQ